MGSLKRKHPDPMLSKDKIRRSKSFHVLPVTTNVKDFIDVGNQTVSTNEHGIIKSTDLKGNAREANTTDTSMISESRIFMIKTLLIGALICLPGNLFAFKVLYNHARRSNAVTQLLENTTVGLTVETTANDLMGSKEPSTEANSGQYINDGVKKVCIRVQLPIIQMSVY